MDARLTPNRSAEYNFRTPSGRGREAPGAQGARGFYYARLMRVSVSHNYYNLSDDQCPDFTFSPTPATGALMRSLGLLFKSEPTGFSVLYNEQRRSDLAHYLRSTTTSAPGVEVWPRLTFTLSLNNPYFINFTDIPFDLDPGRQNFYFTNQDAHRAGGEVILNRDEYVRGRAGVDLFDVIPVQHPLPVGKSVREVHVTDITGRVVICEPRCLPPRTSTVTPLLNCDQPQTSPPSVLRCRNVIYLNFASLPEDKYRIEQVPDRHPGHGREGPEAADRDVLYTASAPLPFALIDLLFTDPADGVTGVYPVRNLSGEPEFVGINYQLKFRTRAPFWTYYVVPQAQREQFEHLRIESVAPTGSAQVNFAGPCCVFLANGERGYRFISEKAIPLQQQAPFQFRLLGRHDLMRHDGVLVENMPVASRRQILRDQLTVLLDMNRNLCPQSKDRDCQRLVRRLGRSLRADSGFAGGMEELKRLAADPRGAQLDELRRSAPKLYSDTYVYV